jgi:uncharacterized protein (DUF488 family)
MNHLFTIGVFGWTAESFFGALATARVDLFLDLRRRRGVRGSEYAWANARRLTAELERCGIPYRHILDLAPAPATREVQHSEDAAKRVTKRARTELSDAFVAEYSAHTLDPFNWQALIDELDEYASPVLFCVERLPAACHRHLVAARLSALTGADTENLVP